jgi:hypothetical protein
MGSSSAWVIRSMTTISQRPTRTANLDAIGDLAARSSRTHVLGTRDRSAKRTLGSRCVIIRGLGGGAQCRRYARAMHARSGLAVEPSPHADEDDRRGRQRPVMVDMEVIVRLQIQEHCPSITCMIRPYVARRAKVIFDHPHNADVSA